MDDSISMRVTQHERDVLKAAHHATLARREYDHAEEERTALWQSYERAADECKQFAESLSRARYELDLVLLGIECPNCGKYVEKDTAHLDHVEQQHAADGRTLAQRTSYSCAPHDG